MKQLFALFLIFFFVFGSAKAQGPDFVRGFKPVFDDRFMEDPVGDLPAKWSTSGSGEVVTLDRLPGHWFKISQPTAVSPELTEALPENCTIEFDLFLKNTGGVAPHIMFGLTTLSDVASGDIYRNHLWVKCEGYNQEGVVFFGKQTEDLGNKSFRLSGFVGRKLHVSMSVNKTRFRVWLDKQKVVDLPKVLTDEYRNNFFIACSEVIPASEESVYFSNVHIAEGEIDARSLRIKQMLESGTPVINDVSFTPGTNDVVPESVPYLDTIGQIMSYDPTLNIQINGNDASMNVQSGGNDPSVNVQVEGGQPAVGGENPPVILSEEEIKMKVESMKAYLVKKFNLGVDRIVTGVNKEIKATKEKLKQSKFGRSVTSLLTEIKKF